jgi:trimeric autotransporter adhesin
MRSSRIAFLLAGAVLLVSCGGSSNNSSSSSAAASGSAVLNSITLSPSSASIAPGTTQAFTATGNYSDGSTKDLTTTAQWACLLPSVATVSTTFPTQGLALAVAPGEALITASSGGVSNSATLNIKSVSVSSVAVTPATATVGYGDQQQFMATATFNDNSSQDVTNQATWSSPVFPAEFVTTNSGLAIGNTLNFGNAPAASSISASFGGSTAPNATFTVNLSNLVSIAISPSNPSIANHTGITFAVIGTFSDGSTRDVSSLAEWTADNPSVATFGFTGSALTAKAVGSSSISASVGTLNASTNLNVTGAQLQSITVLPANATIAATTTLDFTAIGTFSDSTTQDLTSGVTWLVSNPATASVDGKGEVTGAGAGPTEVSAVSSSQLGSIQGSAPLNVTSASLSSISVSPATAAIAPGATFNFSATGKFSDGSSQDLTSMAGWSSNLPSVATVPLPSSATVIAQGIGQARITAKVTGISGTANLAVASPKQITLAVSSSPVQIAAQSSTQLTATGTFIDGTTQNLTTVVNWTSSTPNVATVGYETGVVSGLSPGQSTITATLGSATATVQLTITNAMLQSISISPSNPMVTQGSTEQFSATGNFSDGTSQSLAEVDWTSSSMAIARMSRSGLATTTGAGSARVTATLNGVSGTTGISVP